MLHRQTSEAFGRRIQRIWAATSALLMFAGPAAAGPLDSALPSFSDGSSALRIGLLPTVIKNNGIETMVICTNVGSSPANIGVEIFSKTGTLSNSVSDNNGSALNVPVGATVTIATSGIAGFTEDERIRFLPQIRNGSGRIVATTREFLCVAIAVDEFHIVEDPAISMNAPPTLLPLPVWMCGNANVEPLEECDDANRSWVAGERCRTDCSRVACADPDDSGVTVASDALFALRSSVDLADCATCICDVDRSGTVTAVDALRILRFSIGTATVECARCS